MVKADLNGLPAEASNSDTDVADAVTKKHSQNTDSSTSATTFAINGNNAIVEGDSRLTDARTPKAHTHAESDVTSLTTDLGNKQATLVSGTNIKTINGNTLLDSGDMTGLPDMVVRKQSITANTTIADGYSAEVFGHYAISSGTLTLVG